MTVSITLIINSILLGIGLAMDAFAVSICKGLALKKMDWKKSIREKQEKVADKQALLDELTLWFIGDNPFNINYMIYDTVAFDQKYGSDLTHAKVVPTNLEDQTPENEQALKEENPDMYNAYLEDVIQKGKKGCIRLTYKKEK